MFGICMRMFDIWDTGTVGHWDTGTLGRFEKRFANKSIYRILGRGQKDTYVYVYIYENVRYMGYWDIGTLGRFE